MQPGAGRLILGNTSITECHVKVLLAILALVLATSSALAVGCPPGSKQHCLQTKKGVQCYCR